MASVNAASSSTARTSSAAMRRSSRSCTSRTSPTRGSVPDEWRAYFDALQHVPGIERRQRRGARAGRRVVRAARQERASWAARASSADLEPVARKQVQVAALLLVTAYRIARRALGRPRSAEAHGAAAASPSSSPAFYDLTEADLDLVFNARLLLRPATAMTLRELVQALRETYCRTIGVEYMYITEPTAEALDAGALEPIRAKPQLQRRAEEAHPRTADRGRSASSATCTPSTSARSASRSKAARASSPSIDELIQRAGAQRRAGDRHRHGAPRPPQRAGQHARQDAEGPVRRVRGHGAARTCPSGDVKYHQGFSSRHHDAGRPGAPERSRSTRRTSRSSIRWSKARCARASDRRGDTRRRRRCCRCWCTATPRSPARAW